MINRLHIKQILSDIVLWIFIGLFFDSIGAFLLDYSKYGSEMRLNLIPYWSSPHAYSVLLFSILYFGLYYFQKEKAIWIWVLCDGIYESLGQAVIIQYYIFRTVQTPIYWIVFDYPHIIFESLVLIIGIALCWKYKIEMNWSMLVVLFAYGSLILANSYMGNFVNNSFTIPEFFFEFLFVVIMIVTFLPSRIGKLGSR